jgi:hypothetical protein
MKGLKYGLCAAVLAGLFSCDTGRENEPELPEVPFEDPIDWISNFGDETVNSLFYRPCTCSEDSLYDYKKKLRYIRECMLTDYPADAYRYPLYPGMKEWAELKSWKAMEDACQVPADTVKKMSTQALVQALWEHPLLTVMIDMPFQYQSNFNAAFFQNNAYGELCARPDAASSLTERLKTVTPLMAKFVYGLDLMDILLAQEVFISQLDTEERITVIRYALKKDQLKRQAETERTEPFFHMPFMCMMLGRILLNADYRPFVEEVGRNARLNAYLTLPTYEYGLGTQGAIPRTIANHAMRYTQFYDN